MTRFKASSLPRTVLGVAFFLFTQLSCTARIETMGAGAATKSNTRVTTGNNTMNTNRSEIVEGLRAAAIPLKNKETDYDALMKQIGDAEVVMLGEATHGTHEFYRERMRITQRLIREKGFIGVVVEGDWPDAYRVNCYVRGEGDDKTPEAALGSFSDFPRWMWRNEVARDLVAWMRQHNASLPAKQPRAGFYGMDVYSLPASIDAVQQHLQTVDAKAAQRSRKSYECFDGHRADPQSYGLAALMSRGASCEQNVANELQSIQKLYDAQKAGPQKDELFSALQNARVVRNAEEYYRVMFEGGASSWNLRDKHMADTLDALRAHLGTKAKPAKIVVWAHNSHVGDARETAMGESGEWTVGQLMRQRHDGATFLLGFATYTGSVIAAEQWGEEGRKQRVLPALPGSFAALFHETGIPSFLLPLRGQSDMVLSMGEPRLERAIGVVYLPRTERQSHYFQARMSRQFDAVIHIDNTTAVKPLRP